VPRGTGRSDARKKFPRSAARCRPSRSSGTSTSPRAIGGAMKVDQRCAHEGRGLDADQVIPKCWLTETRVIEARKSSRHATKEPLPARS